MSNGRFGPPSCPACHGLVSCYGGGVKSCAQRDPKPSRIAGILDSYGGVRVVVTRARDFRNHVRASEFLCLVPGKRVHEPIAWGDIPPVIALGELAVRTWVERNERANDPEKREAIRAYRSRQTWHQQRSLDLEAIVYT